MDKERGKVVEKDAFVWQEVGKLLQRKSWQLGKEYDLDERLAIVQRNITNETKAALVFVLGKDNPLFPYEVLNKDGREQYARFERLERKRQEVSRIYKIPEVYKLASETPPLQMILESKVQDGVITPLLSKMGIEAGENIESFIDRFLVRGEVAGGALVLMRKILYQQWLASGGYFENSFGQSLDIIVSKIGKYAYSGRLEGNGRNLCHFLSFLIQKEVAAFVGNYSATDEEFFELFPVIPYPNGHGNVGADFAYNLSDLGALAQSRLERYKFGRRYLFSVDPVRYWEQVLVKGIPVSLRNHAWAIINKSRTEAIEEIADLRGMGAGSAGAARKIYDTGINLIDYLLLSQNERVRPKEFLRELSPSPLIRFYQEYLRIIREYNAAI